MRCALPPGDRTAALGRQGSQKSGKATRRNNMSYKYRRARTSRVGLVHENQDALCLPLYVAYVASKESPGRAGASSYQRRKSRETESPDRSIVSPSTDHSIGDFAF
jgi:hypothetical protein